MNMNSLAPLLLCLSLHAASYEHTLPTWFEENRVQAHNEHGIEVAVAKAPYIHDVINKAGVRALTRIILNCDEGAWWPSAVGEVHELTKGRDVAVGLIDDLHGRGMKMIGYFRYMSDALIERAHPDWVCRNWDGTLTIEPRTRRRKVPAHVICIHSPYKNYIRTRLIELAERGLDVVYFDSWHMPAACTCEYTRQAYEKETGRGFPVLRADDDSPREIVDGFETYPVGTKLGTVPPRREQYGREFLEVSDFVSRSLVRTFTEWRDAARKVKPDIFFAIGSSLYPCYYTQPHLTDDFLEIADTSKTEFHKPFGGRPSVMAHEPDFAAPTWDVQTALGWMWIRDSCDGRPPLMWIPFITEEKEARYSSGAAVAYGCIASLHLKVIHRRKMEPYAFDHQKVFGSSFEVGRKVSPQLAYARPVPWVTIHISDRARNARIKDVAALWKDVFSPVLGAFQVLKEEHLPCTTITDKGLAEGRIAVETKVIILPWPDELTPQQKETIERCRERGVTVIALDHRAGWWRASRKLGLTLGLTQSIYERAGRPPIRIAAPPTMHAIPYKHLKTGALTVCLMNSWGWYRSERPTRGKRPSDSPHHISRATEPPACTGVTIEIDHWYLTPTKVFEVIDSADLVIERSAIRTVIHVPNFQINNCVVIQ